MSDELTLDQRIILDGARLFTNHVTQKYPQSQNGELHYYVGGSLAIMLLGLADVAQKLDDTVLPTIVTLGQLELSSDVRLALSLFTRRIGDFDFVETGAYTRAKEEGIPDFRKDPDGYSAARKRFLWKGHAGPSFNELTPEARRLFNVKSNSESVFCDPVTSDKDDVLKLDVAGREVYVNSPMQVFANKVLQMVECYDHKSAQFNRDFPLLYKIVSALFDEEEIRYNTYDILCFNDGQRHNCSSSLRDEFRRLERQEHLHPTAKDFLGGMHGYDSKKIF
ncbi:MAG: hypothetical protein ABIH82_06235 [Candidatus Woesearchaeota archaeon]